MSLVLSMQRLSIHTPRDIGTPYIEKWFLSAPTANSGKWQFNGSKNLSGLLIKNVPVLSFNGTDNFIDLASQNWGNNHIIEWGMNPTIVSGIYWLFGLSDNTGVYISSSNLTYRATSAAAAKTLTYTLPLSPQKYRIVRNGTAISLFTKAYGETSWTSRFSGTLADNYNFNGVTRIGARPAGTYYSGTLFDVSVTVAGTETYAYPCENASGTTIHNVIANANHGTFSGTTGAQWSLNTNGLKTPYNMTYGFRLASGVYIPALKSGASAANGAAITNPAGNFYNFAVCTLELNGEIAAIRTVDNTFSIPFFYASATPGDVNQINPASDIVADYESANKLTARITGSTKIENFKIQS